MAWGFLDWVRGRPRKRDPDELALSPNASARDLREVALLIPADARGYKAYQLLDQQKDRARPVLERLFREDARFRSMEGEVAGWGKPPLEMVLTVLVRWQSEFALGELASMVASPDPRLRAIAAELLGSTGQARFVPAFTRLAADGERRVRDALERGLEESTDSLHGYSLDDSVALALYDTLRDAVLRTDAGWGGKFASVLLRVDRQRAVADFTSRSALTIDRCFLDKMLEALRDARVPIPKERMETLLSEALREFERHDYDRLKSRVNCWLVEELITCLAEHDPDAAGAHIRALRSHSHAEAREAAQLARPRVMGDPIGLAFEAASRDRTLKRLRHEHKVVYLVAILDGEVCNGGWLQWVANPGAGEHAPDTLAALREIGAHRAATQLEQTMAALAPDGWSPKQKTRMAAIDRMMTAGRSLPDDGVIWEMSTELQALCFDYAERHPDAFPPTIKAPY